LQRSPESPRSIESTRERLKIIPTSLDYSTIWERVRNMNITFPETNDQLEADTTGKRE